MSVAPARLDEDSEAGVVDAVAEARAKLGGAFASRTKALKEAEAARVASGRSRALVADLAAETSRLEAEDRAIAEARALEIRKAMQVGREPKLAESSKAPAIAAALAESRNRLAAARLAEAQLLEAEAQSDVALAAAEAAIKASIKGVVQAEADGLAERLLDARAEADDLHERLGIYGSRGFLSHYLDPKNGTALSQAMCGPVWELNGGPWKRSAAHQVKWQAFAKALEQDANAPLELD